VYAIFSPVNFGDCEVMVTGGIFSESLML
jgi:hypothetical protein